MKLILTSGHRVGSRWLHYLLSQLTGQAIHPELGTKWFSTPQKRNKVASLIRQGKLVKFHGVYPSRIYKNFGGQNFKVLVVVRNPRDRAVSYAFHNRYHDRTTFRQKILGSDQEAVEYTVYRDNLFRSEAKQQIKIMVPELSTRSYSGKDSDYIWTCYEWLKEDIYSEIKTILNSAHLDISDNSIKRAIADNSFKAKAGRSEGQESRKDLWRRKGIVGDWKNWYTEKMIEDTQEEFDNYFKVLSLCSKDE